MTQLQSLDVGGDIAGSHLKYIRTFAAAGRRNCTALTFMEPGDHVPSLERSPISISFNLSSNHFDNVNCLTNLSNLYDLSIQLQARSRMSRPLTITRCWTPLRVSFNDCDGQRSYVSGLTNTNTAVAAEITRGTAAFVNGGLIPM